jgi:hypothetical protein
MKGVLLWLVRWARYPAGCSSQPSTKYYFPYRKHFYFNSRLTTRQAVVLGRLSLCLWVFYILQYVQVVPLPGKGMGCVATRKGFHKPYSKELDKNVQQLLSDIFFSRLQV